MHSHMPTAQSAVLRIAVPGWGRVRAAARQEITREPASCREEFKRILDGFLEPPAVLHFSLTKGERRQLAAQRRLRSALYEMPISAT